MTNVAPERPPSNGNLTRFLHPAPVALSFPLAMNRDSFHYALENTRTHLEPSGLIETFGSTAFDFTLVSELMDEVNRVRLRRGTLQAERPRIVTPEHYAKIMLDGFGEKAREFADWLGRALRQARIVLHDERLSSFAADEAMERDGVRASKRRQLRDAYAAAVILQEYLEGLGQGTSAD